MNRLPARPTRSDRRLVRHQVLILRNHGVMVCGETVEEAYLLLDSLVLACQSQVAMMAAGVDQLVQVSSVALDNMIKVCGTYPTAPYPVRRLGTPFMYVRYCVIVIVFTYCVVIVFTFCETL